MSKEKPTVAELKTEWEATKEAVRVAEAVEAVAWRAWCDARSAAIAKGGPV